MSLDTHATYAQYSASPPEPQPAASIGLRANWSERVVTAVATGIAVLIVAAITVLMGMT